MSAPPGWHPDPNLSREPLSAEAVAGLARALAFRRLRRAGGWDRPEPVRLGPERIFGAAGQRMLTQRNSTTLTAIVAVALYLVLAATTGIVLIGIFPTVLALRAFQRREPLAALAVAAAALAIVVSMTVLIRH
jgi:hypothetical protein